MEKKEQLWERLAPIVLEREDGFGDITVGGATDQQGKDNLLNFISQELDKAREEGYQNCMDDIWEKARELRAWTEHDGNICANDIEAGLQEAYLEISKLKQ